MYLTHVEDTAIKSAIDKVAGENGISRRKAREIVFSSIGTESFMDLANQELVKGGRKNGNGCNRFKSA